MYQHNIVAQIIIERNTMIEWMALYLSHPPIETYCAPYSMSHDYSRFSKTRHALFAHVCIYSNKEFGWQ